MKILRSLLAACLLAGPAAADAWAGDLNVDTAADELVTVIVQLDEAPVARYRGGIPGLAATSRTTTGAVRLDPRSAAIGAYRAHLAARHAAFAREVRAAIPGSRVLYELDMVIGGIVLEVPAGAIPTLAGLPGVLAVHRDGRARPDTVQTPAFIGAKAVWGKLGGQRNAGEGVIVGIIDTGIWPEHPSFADPDPSGRPYTAPPGTRACAFSGGAHPGPAFACNGKLIGAYRFMAGYEACADCAQPAADFSSARDGDGHGTHTASTAAGNGPVVAEALGFARGKVSGIAPRAQVIAYKVCGEDSCFQSDSVAAINQAILDGVDVINFSISGGTNPYYDVVELAFLDAYESGIFVAASAGNNGPFADTVGHRGPWVTTTAASTPKKLYRNKLSLKAADGAKLKLVGASFTPGIKTPAPFVLAASAGDPRCLDATADGAFTGMIVGCLRGNGARVTKGFNVAQRGAVGMVLYNDPSDPSQQGVSSDSHMLPAVQLDTPEALKLLAFAGAHANLTASFTPGKLANARADEIAAFSSRGGPNLALGVLKPDIAAPGVQTLAGDTPEGYDPAHRDGEFFRALDGTSMASPHIAGAAALLRHAHPTWTPGEIKSALMTTAWTKKVVREDGTTPFSPFDGGAGRVALKPALAAAAAFDVAAGDYRGHADDLWAVNYPSIFLPVTAPDVVTIEREMRSTLAKASKWKLSIVPAAGLSVTVPATVVLPAGGTATIPITIDKSGLAPGAAAHATLRLKGKGTLHLPISAVGTRPLPNLRITAASMSSPISGGSTAAISVTLANVGSGAAVVPGTMYTELYLSTDAVLSADDWSFGWCSFWGILDAGDTDVCAGDFTFDASLPVPPGSYRLLVLADAYGAVPESNESDNLFVAPGTIVVQ